jgi:hypothetical protein
LAVVALDQLAADVVRDGQELSAAEIRTEELYRHVSRTFLGSISADRGRALRKVGLLEEKEGFYRTIALVRI